MVGAKLPGQLALQAGCESHGHAGGNLSKDQRARRTGGCGGREFVLCKSKHASSRHSVPGRPPQFPLGTKFRLRPAPGALHNPTYGLFDPLNWNCLSSRI